MSAINLQPGSSLGAWAHQPFCTDLQQIKEISKPSDRIRRKRYKHHFWAVYSPRVNHRLGLYGDLAHDHWVLVESDARISWFTVQPIPIWQCFGHRRLARPFDMVLQCNGTFECCRLGYEDEDLTQADAENIFNEREACATRGMNYRLINRQNIEHHRQLINNWKMMLPYIRGPRHRLDDRVLGYVSAVGALNLGELDVLLADIDESEARAAVFGLLHQGLLVAPELSHEPLSSTTTVRMPYENGA